jgi:2-polyprenyl-6-hydroxyphenyl methylase/3-demethylubiquinone-9 3-methyltransferase
MTMSGDLQFATPASHADEMAAGERFGFGANWARFLGRLDPARIADAERSLQQMLAMPTLQGLRFLDAGSGSGLFSLAARRLGAIVHSFDYDPQSVACTRFLRDRHVAERGESASDPGWQVEEGSVLDASYLEGLGDFDVVYSWGVLHHTGDQWTALDNVSRRVRPGGRLFIAIYNDQGLGSRWWTGVKRLYNRQPLVRWPLIALYTPYFIWLRWLYRQVTGLGKVGRGMTLWYDMIDWLGGYPFEVATPEAVFRFARARDFELRALTTAGGTAGCNEFVFERVLPEDGSARREPEASGAGQPRGRTAA